MTVIPPLMQIAKREAAVTLRYRRIRGGIVAFSCFQAWTIAKQIIRRMKSTNNTMIRALFHEYLDPPHSKAIRRQTILGRKKSVPRGPSLPILSRKESRASVSSVSIPRGLCVLAPRNHRVKRIVTPPTGKLM